MEPAEVWMEDVATAGYTPLDEHWGELERLHAGRPYHNLAHAADVRDWVVFLNGSPLARIAAWYHDAIYEPGGSGSEAASAEMAARQMLAAGADSGSASEVSRLILLTASHQAEDDDHDGLVLCDADLAILGSSPERYVAYVDQIRQEYGFLDDRTFWSGRLVVLERLLARERIYRTAAMADREFLAVVNLRTECGWLQIQIGNAR